MNTIEENKRLVARYPFLLPFDRYTGRVLEGFDYSYTVLDDMPHGWRVAFGEKMCEEIRDRLVKSGCLDRYRVFQIKEKFGKLRWYDFFFEGACVETTTTDIISKYEQLSVRTCILCGKPAEQIGAIWNAPCCNGCAK